MPKKIVPVLNPGESIVEEIDKVESRNDGKILFGKANGDLALIHITSSYTYVIISSTYKDQLASLNDKSGLKFVSSGGRLTLERVEKDTGIKLIPRPPVKGY